MKIGIIVAMEKEFKQLKSLFEHCAEEPHHGKNFVIGAIGDKQMIMQQCGIGKVNAAIGAVEMIDNYHPDLVISTGVAGGADVTMNVTDVVVSTECRYHDAYCGDGYEYGQLMGLPAAFTSPTELVDKALALDCSTQVHAGLIATGEWFVDTKEKMRQIMEKFPQAKAVDMESCAIAHTCYLYKVPFISFRIISDIPLKDTKAAQYFDFWERIAEGSFTVTKAFLEAI